MKRLEFARVVVSALLLTAQPSQADTPLPSECEWNDRVWTAITRTGETNRQELQFIEGLSGGSARISQYDKGTVSWAVDAKFQCSNGAVICSLTLPLISSDEPLSLSYEAFEDDENAYLVIPDLRQSIYLIERHGTVDGKFRYTGLNVQWQGDTVPEDGELINAYNVYKYTECKPSASR